MQAAEVIIDELNAILVSQFEVDPALITPEARMRDDLDLDSLDAADLLIAIEKRFQIRVDDQRARALTTVGQMHDYVRELVVAAGKDSVAAG